LREGQENTTASRRGSGPDARPRTGASPKRQDNTRAKTAWAGRTQNENRCGKKGKYTCNVPRTIRKYECGKKSCNVCRRSTSCCCIPSGGGYFAKSVAHAAVKSEPLACPGNLFCCRTCAGDSSFALA